MISPVWELYRLAHQLTGGVSTLLEWDAKIPAFPVVHAEVLKAKSFMHEALATDVAPATVAAPHIGSQPAVFHPLAHTVVEVVG